MNTKKRGPNSVGSKAQVERAEPSNRNPCEAHVIHVKQLLIHSFTIQNKTNLTQPLSPTFILSPTHNNTHSCCLNIRLPPIFSAMAGLLETLIVPRASALPSASLAPLAGSTSVRFSDFRGLKIQPTRSAVKLSSAGKARGGNRIVCEAQETAVEGLFLVYSNDFLLNDF